MDSQTTAAKEGVLPIEFSAILGSLPVAVSVYDSEDRILYWNDRYFEFFPTLRGEMRVGRPYAETLRIFFETNLAEDELPNIERHLAAGLKRHQDLSEPFTFQSNQRIWVTVTPHRLPDGLYMKVWTEVTPAVVSTEEYRSLLDSITAIHVGFCFFDPDGRFVLSNQRLSEMIPNSVHTFTTGRFFNDFITSCATVSLVEEDAPKFLQLAGRSFPLEETIGPISVQTKEGVFLEYEESRTAKGGLIGVWTNISNRRETERRLRESEASARAARDAMAQLNADLENRILTRTQDLTQALEMAERSDAAKTRLLSNVSHELRTPLNAILGFSQMMSGQYGLGQLPVEKHEEYAGDILESAEYLLTLIDNLLQMSALEKEARLDDIDPMPIGELFEKCDTMLGPMATKAGVTLSFDTDEEVPEILGSKRALTQVILNLGSNALRYTDPGGTLTVSAKTKVSGWVEIKVVDTGAGMPPAQLQSLANPFSSEEYVRTDTKRGAGIGIPLSTLLIQSMNGALAFDSTQGEGTTATITLPAVTEV